MLSALYFSQARDVKRLREWAGRAPERADTTAPAAVPGKVIAQPQTPQAADKMLFTVTRLVCIWIASTAEKNVNACPY